MSFEVRRTRAWIFSFPRGFDLGSYLTDSISMPQMTRLKSRRWSHSVLLNFCGKLYVSICNKLPKGWFVCAVKRFRKRSNYSQGNLGAKEWWMRKEAITQVPALASRECFYKWGRWNLKREGRKQLAGLFPLSECKATSWLSSTLGNRHIRLS